MTKVSLGGASQFLLFNGPITLTSGKQVFALNDTPGDVAELSINGIGNGLAGPGGLTVDNGAYAAWGTLAVNSNNSYTGATNINNGRLVMSTAGALGSTSSGTVIGSTGTLAFGGAGTVVANPMNIAEPITITRDTYTGGEFARYTAAIQNNEGDNTISGPLVIDSLDGRVSSNSGNLTISSDIQQGSNVAAATLSVSGTYVGVVTLTGDNTGLLGGIKVGNAATVSVFNHASLGGASAPLTFSGDGYLRINGGFMTDFGSHVVNTTTFIGGIDTPDAGQFFTINESLTGVQINKRGLGTLNLNGTKTP